MTTLKIDGDYLADGVVVVRGAFSPDEVRLAAESIEWAHAHPSELAQTASKPGEGLFWEDFCTWQRNGPLQQFLSTGTASSLAAQLLGGRDTVRLYHDHILIKASGTKQITPWHQDLPYYNVEGRSNVSMWMPVDPVPAVSTLRCVRGTHLGEWFMPRTFLTEEAKWFPEGTLAEIPDIDAKPDAFSVLEVALEPGDALFFHMLTLHGARGVDGPHDRRALSVRFLGDDMVHRPRPWRTSPPFAGLANQLADGAPLDHPLFPVVWSPEAGALAVGA